MAIPLVYSELALSEYMHQVLGRMAGRLAWAVGEHSYDEIVNDALTVYGNQDISAITGSSNIEKLRAVARFSVWRAAAEHLSADYDFSTDGQTFNRSQMQKAAAQARDNAERELIAVGVGIYAPTSTRTVYVHDPYNAILATDRIRP